jgi:hypothetical protein
LRGAREAISTVTLVPSAKTTVGEALDSWWKRINSDDTITHIEAVQEGAARLMITIAVGALMWGLAHAFIGSAAGAVGSAVGQALRTLLGR